MVRPSSSSPGPACPGFGELAAAGGPPAVAEAKPSRCLSKGSSPKRVTVLPRGTRVMTPWAREQLYLATRLAIVNQLDHEHERLPMFIDEALVNWDAARRNRGFQLLRELSQTRQVFVMTCHENWAEELTEAGAHRIDLA